MLPGIDEEALAARMLAGIIDGWKKRRLTRCRGGAGEAGALNQKGVDLYAASSASALNLMPLRFRRLLLHMVRFFRRNRTCWKCIRRSFAILSWTNIRTRKSLNTVCGLLRGGALKYLSAVGAKTSRFYGLRGRRVAHPAV